MHRPFDGAFPADYPAELALRQCTEVAQKLVGQPSKAASDRAYTMLLMAEDGLHSFDYEAGRQVYADMEVGELDDDAKRTVILKLHPDPNVGQLLLQRYGISSRWLTGNGARSLSRLMRHYEYPPAFTRNLVERLGNNPDTYYMIGPDYRNLPKKKKRSASKRCSKLGSRAKPSKPPWRRWAYRLADTTRPNEEAKPGLFNRHNRPSV